MRRLGNKQGLDNSNIRNYAIRFDDKIPEEILGQALNLNRYHEYEE